MCGIVGFITKETTRGATNRRRFFENGLIADAVRGDDSTGLFSVQHATEGEVTADWVKIASNPHELLATKLYQDKVGNYNSMTTLRALVGHNRSATSGKVDNDNAHPFQEGPITLVHNGTLSSTFHMKKSMWDLRDSKVEVDSHVIAHNLADHTDPAEVIKELDGAFTLVWHDARNNTVNMIRNDRRPLHLTWVTCEDTLLFASEGEMLYWLAGRNDFKLGPIMQPKPGQLLTFHPGSIIPEVRSCPLYVPAYGYGRRSGWTSHAYASHVSHDTSPWAGAARKVPETLELTLLEADLGTDMILKFVPSALRQIPGRRGCLVSGSIEHPDGEVLPAVVMGLDYEGVKECITKQEVWSVFPVGIRGLEDNRSIVMCKLWARVGPSKKDERRHVPQSHPRLGSRRLSEYVQGPHQEWIPMHEWLNHTADGCVQCGQMIEAEDAEEIEWVQGQSRPLCPECQLDNIRIAGIM